MKEENKWICAIAYIIFFIPILINIKNEKYKFHANQGLNLLLLSVAISIIGSIIPFIGWFLILPVGGLLCFILAVMGVINAINGTMKELPLIGKYKLIK